MEPRPPKSEAAPRIILVVDGDTQSLRIVDVSLRRAGFDVRAASDGTVAASLLERTPPPDLVISEVDLPGLDGFELCRRAKAHPAKIPFVFLARPNTANRIKSVELGADDYLSKPVFVKEIINRIGALLQRHERERLSSSDAPADRLAGSLGDLSMIELLQTISTNGRSGVLHLRTASGAHGEVYFRKGAVVDAEVGRLSGADAVYRLLSWTDGQFEIEWRNIRRRDTVVLSAPALLMEGMRRLDEWTRQTQQLPPLETVFEVDYRLLAERLADIPDEVNAILRLFDGLRTVMQVIDDGGLSDLEALTVIGKLSHERLIRNVSAPAGDDDDEAGPDLEGWLRESKTGASPPALTSPARSPAASSPPASSSSPSTFAAREASPAEVASALRARRASDQSGTAPGPVSPPSLSEAPAAPSIPSERRERSFDQRHEDGPVGHAGIPEVRPDEPAVVIPFPSSSTPSLRQTLTSSSGGPAAAIAGEISNGVSTGPSAAPSSSPPLMSVSVPRSTDPGLGPFTAGHFPPLDAAHPGHAAPPSEPPPPALELPPLAPAVAHASTTGSSAAVPARRDSGPKVAELPFSDSASRWMTEGDEIHGGRAKSEALEELALPSRFRGLVVIAAVVVLAGGAFFAVRAFRGGQAADPGPEKPASPAAATAAAAPPSPTEGAPSGAQASGGPATAPAVPAAAGAGSTAPLADDAPSPTGAVGAGAGAGSGSKGAPNSASAAAATVPAVAAAAGEPAADSEEAARLVGVCQSAFSAGRMKDATTACTAALEANPDSAKVLSLLAHAEFNRSHRKEALSWAEKAVKIDPKTADAYVIIGGVQQDAGRNAEAKSAYRKYLELAPKGQYASDLRAIVDSL